MALTFEVDATAHAALSEAQRGLYVAGDAGRFRLDISGLEDTTGLKTALEKERTANRGAKTAQEAAIAAALLPFAGIDPIKTRALFSQFEDADEAALIATGRDGIEKVITKRTEKHTTAMQKLIDTANTARDGALKVASTYMERALDSHIRASATKAGMHAGAIDDALLRARALFSLDDDGNAVQFDEDKVNVVLGKDGKTPFSPDEWLESMKESAPHWFPAGASGAGANGSGKGVGAGKTMKRATFNQLDPVSRAAQVKAGIVVID